MKKLPNLSRINSTDGNDTMTLAESKPLLTVIVAVFNGNTTLQQCIDSVAANLSKQGIDRY